MPTFEKGIENGVEATIDQLDRILREEGYAKELGIGEQEALKILNRLSGRSEDIRTAAAEYHK